MAYYILLLIL